MIELLSVKMSDLTIGHIVLLFAFGIISIFAIKIAITLNLNDFLKERKRDKKETLKRQIQMTCLHMEIRASENGGGEAESYFTSPTGTINWICKLCGIVKIDKMTNKELERVAIYYNNNPKEYLERIKKLEKLTKKL